MKNESALSPRRLFRHHLYNPLKAMAAMESDMEKWFGTGGMAPSLHPNGVFDFAPACDVNETEKEFILKFDIPGMKKDDIKIEIEDNHLTVRGERKQEKDEKSGKQYLSESYYGSFLRSFSLPCKINESEVNARYQDGVLTIQIPKANTTKAKEISIK